MKLCTCLAVMLIVASSCLDARAQTVINTIVNDNFESYPLFSVDGGAAFKQVWMETDGGGNNLADPSHADSAIVTDAIPDSDGKAVDHLGGASYPPGMVNQWDDDNNLATIPFNIVPSANEHIQLSADIYVGNSGNERMTVGLRGRNPSAANLLEMGVYNTAACDARVEGCASSAAVTSATPGYYPFTGYGYRLILHEGYEGLASTSTAPNWGYFILPAELDRADDTDEFVNIGDVGAGWHTYTATITPTDITLTLDLFRDGFVNIRDENGDIIQSEPGVDASITWGVTTNTAVAYDSLRIGGPSGLTSAGPGTMGFDNILLQMIEPSVVGQPGDHDGDGDVDAADYVAWRKDPNSVPAGYQEWVENFGEPSQSGSGAVGAAPEPTTFAMLLLAVVAVAAGRRCR